MTRRTAPPPGPETFAERFLVPAQRIIERCLARSPQVDRHAAVLRLSVILGGGWHLLAEGEVLGSGELDSELDYPVRALTRACLSELDQESRGRLLARMDGSEELPGSEPSHFRVVLVLEGAGWTMKVSAHARGAGAVLTSMAGVLEPAQARAAA